MCIKINDLSFSWGEKEIFKDFSLAVARGERVWLSAESGYGKTTLLRLIAGLETPKKGSVTLPKSARLSVSFQEDRLMPWLTAKQNIALQLEKMDKTQREQRALKYLRAVGLENEADTYPAALSGGMARRVALARALAVDYDIILLDEPFTGIDETTRQRLGEFMDKEFEGKTVVLVTHDPAEAQLLSAVKVALG